MTAKDEEEIFCLLLRNMKILFPDFLSAYPQSHQPYISANNRTVDVIYTDFVKAFDKCETNVLLHTLRDCGVKGKIRKWIAAFLDTETRIQAVGVDGSLSDLEPVVSGVPQGTVLGPVLFLVHILGLCSNLSLGTSSSYFADDTRIWRGISNATDCSNLQDDLQSQSVYASADLINMAFNSKIFEWVRYTAGLSTPPDFQYLAPESSNISQKSDLRDLGVRMSNDLTFTLRR
jgi:ribonuclease P/MRP protein subunit RPP40